MTHSEYDLRVNRFYFMFFFLWKIRNILSLLSTAQNNKTCKKNICDIQSHPTGHKCETTSLVIGVFLKNQTFEIREN